MVSKCDIIIYLCQQNYFDLLSALEKLTLHYFAWGFLPKKSDQIFSLYSLSTILRFVLKNKRKTFWPVQ